MKEKKWKLIFKWENISTGITLLIAIIITILSLFGKVGDNVVNSTILFILISLSWQLFYSYIILTKLKNQLEDPVISKILKSYDDKMIEEIRNHLKSAKEIWLLTRTGQSFITYVYKKEFEEILKERKGRFLFLAPENLALEMVANVVKEKLEKLKSLIHNPIEYKEYLNSLREISKEEIDIRVIDYLPAWTLVIINPTKLDDHSIIYIELATYRAKYNGRPVFKVTPQDGEYFTMFLNEFNEMWKDAKSWKLKKINKRQRSE